MKNYHTAHDPNSSYGANIDTTGKCIILNVNMSERALLNHHEAQHLIDILQELVDRILAHLREGRIVKIYTARDEDSYPAIRELTRHLFGIELEITNIKDSEMEFYYCDRARQVIPNVGILVEEARG